MSKKSRTKSSRSDKRTLYTESTGIQVPQPSLLLILFKAYILKVTAWCKEGCQIPIHHICITDSKNEGRWVAGCGEGDSLHHRKGVKILFLDKNC